MYNSIKEKPYFRISGMHVYTQQCASISGHSHLDTFQTFQNVWETSSRSWNVCTKRAKSSEERYLFLVKKKKKWKKRHANSLDHASLWKVQIILYAHAICAHSTGSQSKSVQFLFHILISVKSRGLRLIITDQPQAGKKNVQAVNKAWY